MEKSVARGQQHVVDGVAQHSMTAHNLKRSVKRRRVEEHTVKRAPQAQRIRQRHQQETGYWVNQDQVLTLGVLQRYHGLAEHGLAHKRPAAVVHH